MYKLMILIEALTQEEIFEQNWPHFLHYAEQMPGLKREVTSRITHTLYGKYPCMMVHELYFETLEACQQALTSLQGKKAGEILQQITSGQVTLFLAQHLEDSLHNIQKLPS